MSKSYCTMAKTRKAAAKGGAKKTAAKGGAKRGGAGKKTSAGASKS